MHPFSLILARLLTSTGLKNQWVVTLLINALNSGVNYTIPVYLKPPGYYLVRYDITALHSAYSEGEA
jgi:hypothetical protein